MNEIPNPAYPQDRAEGVKKIMGLAAGLGVFMVLDFIMMLLLESARSFTVGVGFAVLTAGICFLFYRRGERWLAAGIALGFALMTLVTDGTCTLFTKKGEYGEFGGLWYLAITVVALVIAGIARAVVAMTAPRKP
jgi:hypothetical protein